MTDAAAVAWCQHETPVSSRGTVAAEGLGVNTMCCYGRPSLLSPPPKQPIRGTWAEGRGGEGRGGEGGGSNTPSVGFRPGVCW